MDERNPISAHCSVSLSQNKERQLSIELGVIPKKTKQQRQIFVNATRQSLEYVSDSRWIFYGCKKRIF